MTRGFALMLGVLSVLFAAPSRARPDTGEVNLTATSANVKEPGSPVKIHVIRWSTDEERTPVVAALNPAASVTASAGGAAAAPAARGRAGRGGRGGARGGRGTAHGDLINLYRAQRPDRCSPQQTHSGEQTRQRSIR